MKQLMVQDIGKVVVVVAMTLHMDSSKGNDIHYTYSQGRIRDVGRFSHSQVRGQQRGLPYCRVECLE